MIFSGKCPVERGRAGVAKTLAGPGGGYIYSLILPYTLSYRAARPARGSAGSRLGRLAARPARGSAGSARLGAARPARGSAGSRLGRLAARPAPARLACFCPVGLLLPGWQRAPDFGSSLHEGAAVLGAAGGEGGAGFLQKHRSF